MNIELKQKAQWLDNDVETVISLFLGRIGEGPGVLLESVEADGRWGRFSLAARDFLFSAVCRKGRLVLNINDNRLEGLKTFEDLPYFDGLRKVMASIDLQADPEMPAFPAITRGLYGYLGYEAAALMNKKLAASLRAEDAEGVFSLPGELYLFDHNYNQLARLSLLNGSHSPRPEQSPPAPLQVGPVSALMGRDSFLAAADKIKEAAASGRIREALLSTGFSAPFQGDLFQAYRRLRQTDPSPYMFFLRHPEISLAISSPEVLASCDQGRLSLNPGAGSHPLGGNLSEDGLFEEELYGNPMEQDIHGRLVNQALKELGQVAGAESIKVDRFMEVERFPRDMRLASRLSGRLNEGLDAVDVMAAIFPSASVTGLPKNKTVEAAAEAEAGPRGPYGGALGWLGLGRASVDLDLGLITRGLWARAGRVFWRTGSVLSASSDSKRKWEDNLSRAEETLQALLPEGRLALETVDLKALQETEAEGGKIPGPLEAAVSRATDKSDVSDDDYIPAPPPGPAPLPVIMEKVACGRNLSRSNAAQIFTRLMDGELQPSQAGAFLMGLRAKGETPLEMAEAATAVLARAIIPPPLPGPLLDVVGTGGDGRSSFNCSSATALVMAGMGHKVVKHGNRSISSRCGSADVLELLGADLNEGPEMVPIRLKERNFAFLFAPNYHPAFKFVMPVRKELGIRTLFNVLGPLVNPARPQHSFLGAHNPGTAALMAGALARMNCGFSAAVHGAGGYDEMTALGPATAFLVDGDKIIQTTIDPARYGFKPPREEELAISGPEEGAAVLRELLAGGGPAAMRDMLILNVAMATYVLKGGQDFDRCLAEARQGVEDGAGAKVLSS